MIFPGAGCAVSASVLVGDDAVMTCMVDLAGELATVTIGSGFEIVMEEDTLQRLAEVVAEGLTRLRAAREAGPDAG